MCWGAPTNIKGVCMAASGTALGCQPLPSVPLPSKAHPTLLLVRTEAASGFPSHSADCSESPGSCVCSAPSTARPGTLLGRRLTCVTSVNSLRPPCCCLGPPALLSTCVLSLWLPGAGRGGWSQHSSASDRDGPSCRFPVTTSGQHKVSGRKAAVVRSHLVSFVPLLRFFQKVWCSVCKSIILRIAFVNIFVNILVLSLIIFSIFMTWL